MTPLRVGIDARIPPGRFGGVEQVLIGIAAGLSKLEEGDEEYLFLTNPEQDEWIRPYLQGPCRPLHSRRSYVNRRARAIGRALAERAPGIGPRYAVRPSDGTVERAGVEVMHLPIQNAFTTDITSIYQPHDLQHLHLPELFSSWERERRERIYRTYCERAEMVIAMTSWGKGDLIDHYDLPDEKVQVVPWGSVLWEYPEPTPGDLAGLRRRLTLPEEFLLYPGADLAPQESRGHAAGAGADQGPGGPERHAGLPRAGTTGSSRGSRRSSGSWAWRGPRGSPGSSARWSSGGSTS